MASEHVKVLLIEDEVPIHHFVRTTLESHGFALYNASTGAEGLDAIAAIQPNVLILDIGLPDMDGMEVIRKLREWSPIPIIVLSAHSLESDKILSLDAGADDYMTKPFSVGELMARIRAVLRRGSAGTIHDEFTLDSLAVDFQRRRVSVAGQRVHLTPTEYRLLTTLIRNAGRVVTHRQLLREVWDATHVEDVHYLRIYVAQLRRKLERNPARPRYLLTEAGVGYRMAKE